MPDAGDEEIEIEEPGGEDAEAGARFAALSSGDAELDEAIMSETTLQLFPTDDPKPKVRKPSTKESPAEEGEKRESAYAARERLRGDRRRLVTNVARRTGRSHRDVQARVNRATGVRSVANATIEQLEKGNEILRRELWR
jgi:hypothetical protein